MNRRILLKIQREVIEIFIENGKFLRVQNCLGGYDLQISKDIKKKLCQLSLKAPKGFEFLENQLKISRDKRRLEFKNTEGLLGGSNQNSIIEINPQIKQKYEQTCKQALDITEQLAKGQLTHSLKEQMNEIEGILMSYSDTFIQYPNTYRLLLFDVFRIHFGFQFMSEFQDSLETKQEIMQRHEDMVLFSNKLRLVENKKPVLDLYFFQSMITMYYQFKEPAKKLDPSFLDKALPISYQVVSICQRALSVGLDAVSLKFGSLLSGFVDVGKYVWHAYEKSNYLPLMKGINELWTEFAKISLSESIDLDKEILFYMDQFLSPTKKDSSLIVFILMQIDNLLKKVIQSKKKNIWPVTNFLFTVSKFIGVIAIDNQDEGLINQIKEFFNLMTYSVLARYAQLSIQLSLYKIIAIEQQTHFSQIQIEILEMSIIRRYLVESQQKIKILYQSDTIKSIFESKIQQQSQYWSQFLKKNKFKEQIYELTKKVKIDVPADIIQLEQLLDVNSQEQYTETIFQNENEICQIFEKAQKETSEILKNIDIKTNKILSSISIDQNEEFKNESETKQTENKQEYQINKKEVVDIQNKKDEKYASKKQIKNKVEIEYFLSNYEFKLVNKSVALETKDKKVICSKEGQIYYFNKEIMKEKRHLFMIVFFANEVEIGLVKSSDIESERENFSYSFILNQLKKIISIEIDMKEQTLIAKTDYSATILQEQAKIDISKSYVFAIRLLSKGDGFKCNEAWQRNC